MKKFILVSILAILVLSGCKETPENTIVIQKNNEILEDAIKESTSDKNLRNDDIKLPINKNYEYPETWQAQYSKYDNKFNLEIDADVVVTHNSYYPIAEIKPYYIPIEQVNKFILSLCGTLDVELATSEVDKDKIMDVIIQVKADISNTKDDKEKQDELENILTNLYKEYDKAPTSVEKVYYENKFIIEKEDDYERHHIEIRTEPEDRPSLLIEVSNDVKNPRSNGYNTTMMYEDAYREVYGYNDDSLRRMKFVEHPLYNTEQAQNAIKIADKFLSEIGIEDRVLEMGIPRAEAENSKDIVGYTLIYGRKFNDIIIPPMVQFGGSSSAKKNDDYIQPYIYEYLSIDVEDNEIVGFCWDGPFEIKNIIAEDIELLPFAEVMKNVENQLSVKYSYIAETNEKYGLYVDEVILTYAVERVIERPNEFMIIPVWAFYGGYDYGDGQKVSDGRFLEGRYRESASLLTVNAVDGSVIFGR
jgi:hypothetical protein